uniref:Uncharacterized protein n=1 Tax=Anopheles merus TaxID=30066 RepID=A0A182VDK1_ANOME
MRTARRSPYGGRGGGRDGSPSAKGEAVTRSGTESGLSWVIRGKVRVRLNPVQIVGNAGKHRRNAIVTTARRTKGNDTHLQAFPIILHRQWATGVTVARRTTTITRLADVLCLDQPLKSTPRGPTVRVSYDGIQNVVEHIGKPWVSGRVHTVPGHGTHQPGKGTRIGPARQTDRLNPVRVQDRFV